MKVPHCFSRRAGMALAIGTTALLGCASKVLIEVPAGFHGHVHVQCSTLTEYRTTTIKVDANGEVANASCPVRQVSSVVTRSGGSDPVQASALMWTTTGDGLVRDISFDVK